MSDAESEIPATPANPANPANVPNGSDLLDRKKRAEKIINEPEKYKICEGCESIVVSKATTCPSCHGYRFDEHADRVIAQATLLGSRPATTVSWQDYL